MQPYVQWAQPEDEAVLQWVHIEVVWAFHGGPQPTCRKGSTLNMLQSAGHADLDPGTLCKGLHALPRFDAVLAPARVQAQERGQECQRTQPPRACLGLWPGDERQPVQDEIRHLLATMMPFTAS